MAHARGTKERTNSKQTIGRRTLLFLAVAFVLVGGVLCVACDMGGAVAGSEVSYPTVSSTVRLLHEGAVVYEGEVELGSSLAVYSAYTEGSLCNLYLQYTELSGSCMQAADRILPEIWGVLDSIAEHVYVAPQSATAVYDKGKFSYTAMKVGSALDYNQTMRDVLVAWHTDSTSVTAELAVTAVRPTVTDEDIQQRTRRLGEYTTYYGDSSASRRHNIRLAANAIDGQRIPVGGVFSFNSVVGQRTEDRGYKRAGIILDGRIVSGFGGGVCQVSTTLYLAAMLSGMGVVSRAHHSVAVSYVPRGCDATVSEYIDFAFRNDSPFDVYIRCVADGERLRVTMYGYALYDSVTIRSERLKTIPYSTIIAPPEDTPQDAESGQILVRGRQGEVIKTIFVGKKDGVESVLRVTVDTYLPRNQIVSRDCAT